MKRSANLFVTKTLDMSIKLGFYKEAYYSTLNKTHPINVRQTSNVEN